MAVTTAGEDHGDLSVRLDWPVDPLAARPDAPERERADPGEGIAARLASIQRTVFGTAHDVEATADADDVDGGPLESLVGELIEVLRDMNDTLRRAVDDNIAMLDDRVASLRTAMMTMLASRQAEDQRTQRREREELVTHVEGIVTATRTQSDVFNDRVTSELQALRRRIPVGGRRTAIDETTMEELVTRVADEVEIRIAATLKPKPRRNA